MFPNRALVLALVALLLGSVGGAAPVAAQEDVVTLTVTVATPAGDPVGDARLTANWDGGSRTRTTASNGKAFIDVPSGTEVRITVQHDAYVRNFPLVLEEATDGEVSMTVREKASIEVTVGDADGTVEDAEVAFHTGNREVTRVSTDADGTASSGVVETGTYTVTVGKSGYFVSQETVEATGDTVLDLEIRRGTVTLEVNVTDDHFDPPRPLSEATVEVDGSGSVTTQPTGIGRLSVPVNAWAGITVSKAGYESTDENVYVSEEDATVGISIRRTPSISVELLSERVVIGERVSLTVTDEYGDPVPDATVQLDGEVVAETDAAGQAVVAVPSRGNHTVLVEKGSLDAEPRTVVGIGEGQADGGTTGTAEPTGTETEAEAPGFGALVALLALAIALVVGLGRARE